ncbi:hypothetical protein D554_3145 [Bordetella holmesii 30539]|uniref:Uncharacterized protein n=2 Tax=Bordetella holmesii TaxID=35814 RepID=A0A158M371_9BORD|nr:hypothetical protein D560_3245 [Bordetella holmesii ATCC 51541]AIT27856.1 hypothetical protein D558_3213 [Bordetella holmesii 44057]EWM40634.1 hypothetical protein D555_3276 [Bordetella holmesii 35009]EWM43403.1 hypothetical protein D556_3212 [Bordetella holmesii 41130]EWM44531.1 hypothetical protein D557_2517 [Bordetella holmesii 70147]EXF87871.1 hypothetical protein D554_3145 [Bordetella holmesii 30539]EXX93869.1 hypothetical protein D559_1275 [Bordetella holmesii 1058]KAK78602.1 hypoth
MALRTIRQSDLYHRRVSWMRNEKRGYLAAFYLPMFCVQLSADIKHH